MKPARKEEEKRPPGRPGRPKGSTTRGATDVLYVRIAPDLIDWLRKRADADGASLAVYVERLVRDAKTKGRR